METHEKLQRICAALRERGEPGTPYQVAKLLRVSPSTVLRWGKPRRQGGSIPRGQSAQNLDLLYRTVVQAQKGNQDANKILASILGGAGAGLLGLGVGGILIAAGMAWILSDDEGEES